MYNTEKVCLSVCLFVCLSRFFSKTTGRILTNTGMKLLLDPVDVLHIQYFHGGTPTRGGFWKNSKIWKYFIYTKNIKIQIQKWNENEKCHTLGGNSNRQKLEIKPWEIVLIWFWRPGIVYSKFWEQGMGRQKNELNNLKNSKIKVRGRQNSYKLNLKGWKLKSLGNQW